MTTPSFYGSTTNAPACCLRATPKRPARLTMLFHHRVAPANLLKVGHHGSKTSTNPDFLGRRRAAGCSHQRRSPHNTFGHPRAEVLERLEARAVRHLPD